MEKTRKTLNDDNYEAIEDFDDARSMSNQRGTAGPSADDSAPKFHRKIKEKQRRDRERNKPSRMDYIDGDQHEKFR